MACPHCGKVDTVTLSSVFKAAPIGGCSLAGAQFKLSARRFAMLNCGDCGWYVMGRVEGAEVGPDGVLTAGHFYPDQFPDTDKHPE